MSDVSTSCPWIERVSALIDGELPEFQVEMARAHARSCSFCATLIRSDDEVKLRLSNPVSGRLMGIVPNFPDRVRFHHRLLLAAVGALLLLGSIPDFGRANSQGNAFHDLRHLAIWQVAVGVAAASAAITFRISRLVAVMMGTFLALTVFATVYDLMTGHRGPWADPLHVAEVVAGVAILRLVIPYTRLSAKAAA